MKLQYVDKNEFYEFVENLHGNNSGNQTIYKDGNNRTIAICYNLSNIKYAIRK